MADVTLGFIAEQLVPLLEGQREIRHELAGVEQRLQAVEMGLADARGGIVALPADVVRRDHRPTGSRIICCGSSAGSTSLRFEPVASGCDGLAEPC